MTVVGFALHMPKRLVAGWPVANPTTLSYNASAVKNYNATSNLVRFDNKNSFFYFD
jgi:hypothetical protein